MVGWTIFERPCGTSWSGCEAMTNGPRLQSGCSIVCTMTRRWSTMAGRVWKNVKYHQSWKSDIFLDIMEHSWMICLYSCRIVLFGKSFAQAKSHGNWILVASRQMLDIRIMTGDDSNKLLQSADVQHKIKTIVYSTKTTIRSKITDEFTFFKKKPQ